MCMLRTLIKKRKTTNGVEINKLPDKEFKALVIRMLGFPGGTVVKNPPSNAGDTGLSPGLGRFHTSQSN